jgi:hypothetical protein
MPYIPKDRRESVRVAGAYSVGELNYEITAILNDFLSIRGKNYSTLNDIIGVVECAKLEFYRRIAAPYEDEAIVRNGDVYGEPLETSRSF